MKNGLLYLITIFFFSVGLAQPSDFLLLKKKYKTIENFFVGKDITFTTAGGSYSAKIDLIVNDSLYLTQYDIRQVPTNLGVYMLDTLASYKLRFNYNEILKIYHDKKGFNWSASGASLLGGGILISAIGLGTWIFTKPGDRYHASPTLIIGAAALGGLGYLILKLNTSDYIIGKKYKLEYVHVK